MNKSLASFVFSGETLFCLPNEQSSLPMTSEAKVLPKQEETIQKKVLQKRTLVLVSSLAATEKEFLLKVMASVNIQESDMDILTEAEFKDFDLTNISKSKEIISFGEFLKHISISVNSPKYQTQQLENRKILVADSLLIVGQNLANEKRNLWIALKNMYGLS
jgi:hypothetical protein